MSFRRCSGIFAERGIGHVDVDVPLGIDRLGHLDRLPAGGNGLAAGTTAVTAVLALLAPDLGAATLRGRVTECRATAGASGYVVKGFEELRVGFEDLQRPCTIVTLNATQVGTDNTSADGTYSIAYTPSERDPEACFFERRVFVRIFRPDGTTLIHTSAKERATATNAFDGPPAPGCEAYEGL